MALTMEVPALQDSPRVEMLIPMPGTAQLTFPLGFSAVPQMMDCRLGLPEKVQNVQLNGNFRQITVFCCLFVFCFGTSISQILMGHTILFAKSGNPSGG